MAFMRKIGNSYHAVLKLKDGRQKSIALKTGNEREARQRLNKIREKEVMVKSHLVKEEDMLATLKTQGIGSLKLGDLRKKYLRTCQLSLRDSTVSIYREAMDDLIRIFGNKDIRNFNSSDYPLLLEGLQNAVKIDPRDKRRVKRYCDTSINIKLRSIKTFFRWAVESRFLKEMPFRIRQLQITSDYPAFLTDEQIARLFKVAKEKQALVHAAFLVYLETGMRLGEFRESELLDDGSFLKINAEKTYAKRIVPFPLELVGAFNRLKEKDYTDSYLSHRFTFYCRQAKLPEELSFHSLRHSFAVRHWLRYHDIKLTQQMLGHKSVKTTEIYTQIPIDYLKQVCRVERAQSTVNLPYDRTQEREFLVTDFNPVKMQIGCN